MTLVQKYVNNLVMEKFAELIKASQLFITSVRALTPNILEQMEPEMQQAAIALVDETHDKLKSELKRAATRRDLTDSELSQLGFLAACLHEANLYEDIARIFTE